MTLREKLESINTPKEQIDELINKVESSDQTCLLSAFEEYVGKSINYPYKTFINVDIEEYCNKYGLIYLTGVFASFTEDSHIIVIYPVNDLSCHAELIHIDSLQNYKNICGVITKKEYIDDIRQYEF